MLNAKNVELSGIDFTRVFPEEDPDPPMSPFASIEGAFHIQAKGIDLANFVLDHSRGRLQAEGRIDFSHALSLRIRPSIFDDATSPPIFLFTGTIEDPKLAPPASSQSKPSARSGTRGR